MDIPICSLVLNWAPPFHIVSVLPSVAIAIRTSFVRIRISFLKIFPVRKLLFMKLLPSFHNEKFFLIYALTLFIYEKTFYVYLYLFMITVHTVKVILYM
jgi:hypothetical protein